jgi:hypothetical protein
MHDVGNIADAGAAYIYTYNGSSWDEQKLVSPDIEASAQFGTSVSMSSDGMKVIVGAMHDDEGATDTGAAYIFTYSGGSWDAGTKIVAPDKAQDDRFGNSVGMSGDGTKVIVGAYIEDEDVAGGTTLTSAGSAYIFTYNGSSWDTGTKIVASDRAGSDLFGRSVAMNSDGTKAIVGAEGGEAAYIFTYNGSSWVEQQILVASDADAGDKFGFDVAMSGDGTKVIVGAYLEHAGNLSDAGAAYIYTYNGSSWDTGTKIVAPDKEAGDRFGYNVGMSSDGTGVIVGAYLEHAGVLTDTGSAYIYTYDGSNWDTGLKISAPVGDRTANDQFGSSVAMNSDGKKVIVGALLADPNSLSSAGFAHVFTRDTTHHLTTDLKLQSNTWHNLTYAYQGEGGSRVTYLDGRKVAEDQAEDTFGLYPPFDMSGYSQGGYVASASSENTGQGTAPGRVSYKAFNNLTDTNLGVFQTSTGYTSGGTATVDAALFEGALGHWVKLELPTKIKLGYVSVQSAAGSGERVETAKIFGSNDDINWEVIKDTHTLTYIGAVSSYSANSTKYFKYLLFQILSTFSGTVAQLFKLQYYGHRENDLVRLPDPTNVLKYPHIAMTGPAQRGYVVSASNETLADGNRVWHVFDENDSTFWKCDERYTSAGVENTSSGLTDTSSTAHGGEYVVLESPNKLNITGFNLTRDGTNSDTIGRSPGSIAFLGKNSAPTVTTGWTLIAQQTTSTYTNNVAPLTISGNSNYFKYHAVVIRSIDGNQLRFHIKNIELLGTEEDISIPIQIGGGNIDKVANFRVYDKFIGEDQALEIWDAKKDEFGRAKSSMTLHRGRLGIGTTEPQGRLAVADEPDPTTYGLQEFPPKPLAANNTHIEGHGVFRASASTNLGGNPPWKAFDKDLGTPVDNWLNDGWNSSYGTTTVYNTSGTYLGSKNLGGYTGEWIAIEMPYKTNLTKMQIYPRANTLGRSPKDGVLLGSNDGVTWNVVHQFTGKTYKAYEYTDFIISYVGNYSYYGLVMTAGGTVGNTDSAAIIELKLFGTREQVTKQSVLHDGQLTLTKNLNVPRIGPAPDADDTPRRDRLVVEYNTSTNPTFEGAVRDTSGRGLDGGLVGGAYYDANAKAFEFDGTDDYIFTGNIGNHAGAWVHSYSVWINLDDYTNENIVLIGRDASTNKASSLKVNNSTQIQWFFFGSDVTFPHSMTLGSWYHIACVYDGGAPDSSRRMWINGTELTISVPGVGTALNLDANAEMRIGRRQYNTATNHFNGQISNFKLYDTALTASEVKTLYDMGRCDKGHHVVNFSKTRVGIGLGDGEAPRGALDVRGDIYGGCPVFFEVYASGNTGGSAYMNFNQQSVVKGGGWTAGGTAFYAPVSGYYKFDISMMGTYLNGRGTRIEWRINGTKYPDNAAAEMYDYQSAGVTVHLRVSGNTIAYLNVGDWMGIYNSSNDINNYYGKFTGFYLSS